MTTNNFLTRHVKQVAELVRHHGLEKLEEGKRVDHVFISYSRDYGDIEVWRVAGVAVRADRKLWRFNPATAIS